MSLDLRQNWLLINQFQLKIYKSNGDEFQNLFNQIMKRKNRDFNLVKPQGRIGDKGNDGYTPTNKTYYQVYGPENFDKSIKYAVDKLETDFEKAIQYWQVEAFYYVVNDKYNSEGLYTDIHTKLNELRVKYPNIDIGIYIASDLEQDFMRLNINDQLAIVGNGLILPEQIDELCLTELDKIIQHLKINILSTEIPDRFNRAEFDNKIIINNLNEINKDYLTYGSYFIGALDEYFSKFPEDKRNLRKYYSILYNDFKIQITDSNKIFNAIFARTLPNQEIKNIKAQNSIRIMMSYYFESCDIFESE